ncbi:hypothetical protein [Marinobacter sp.]|uniref:head-tail joining protein n=1 Tax=Marinobacter sp. TaxID=50741 RepID=UPI003A94B4A3
MAFRDLVAEVDGAVFAALSDPATLDGTPVQGMFASIWREPAIGKLGTGLVEPQLTLRSADAATAARGSAVIINLPAPDGGEYEVVNIEPDGTGLTALILRPR